MTGGRLPGARLLAGAHLGQAAVLLAQPPAVLRRVGSVPPSWIVRVLGVRTLVQAAAEGIRPRSDVLRLGAFIDLAHAATMLLAAVLWPRYRRAALASASSAGLSAAAGALLVRQRR